MLTPQHPYGILALELKVELSWPACQEMVERKGQKYQEKYPKLAERKEWTPEGWIIHALAHELAHLIIGDEDLAMRDRPLSDIVSEIFAASLRGALGEILHLEIGAYGHPVIVE